MTTKKIEFENYDETRAILGDRDEFLQTIDEKFNCKVISRGNFIELHGDFSEVDRATKVISELQQLYKSGSLITIEDVFSAIKLVKSKKSKEMHKIFGETLIVSARGTHIHAKSLGQQDYIDTMKNNVVTFGIGPAGTGKTFLAVAMAAYYFRVREVKKIVLTRPAVEAGENSDFCPAICRKKLIRTCGRCMMHCKKFWASICIKSSRTTALSKLRHSLTCAGELYRTRS